MDLSIAISEKEDRKKGANKCPDMSQSMLYVPFIEGMTTIGYAVRGQIKPIQ